LHDSFSYFFFFKTEIQNDGKMIINTYSFIEIAILTLAFTYKLTANVRPPTGYSGRSGAGRSDLLVGVPVNGETKLLLLLGFAYRVLRINRTTNGRLTEKNNNTSPYSIKNTTIVRVCRKTLKHVKEDELHENISNKNARKIKAFFKKFCIYFILKKGVFRSSEAPPFSNLFNLKYVYTSSSHKKK
jgi:hypothetical protein